MNSTASSPASDPTKPKGEDGNSLGSSVSSCILVPETESAVEHDNLHSNASRLSCEPPEEVSGIVLTDGSPLPVVNGNGELRQRERVEKWQGCLQKGSDINPLLSLASGRSRIMECCGGSQETVGQPHNISEVSRKCSNQPHSKITVEDQARPSAANTFVELAKVHLANAVLKTYQLVTYIVYVVGLVLVRNSSQSAQRLRQQADLVPLTDTLFSLGSEVSKSECSELWTTAQDTQLAIMVMAGTGIERFLWKELHEVVYNEESWARGLYHLRHTLWPGGKLGVSPRRRRSEKEREEEKRRAVEAFKKFLPST